MSLQSLRNIGPVTAEALYSIGIKTPEQFRQSDPEELYEEFVNRQRKWATSGTKVNGHLGLAPAPPKK